jgi:hypothetical protein
MRYDSYQFGSFDGLDNRRLIMRLMGRLGDGVSDGVGCRRRQHFLQSLLGASTTGMAGKPLQVTPCSAVDAYHLFVAITGVLGVKIEDAAKKLERYVRSLE